MYFILIFLFLFFFFFNATAPTEIYTLSLHDALPISTPRLVNGGRKSRIAASQAVFLGQRSHLRDRKSTRLNSSHPSISYAVFCLKKKKIQQKRLLTLQQVLTCILFPTSSQHDVNRLI